MDCIDADELQTIAHFLELLRLGLVSLVAFAICQPEWLQKFVPSEEPVVAVVWDESESMDTEDILDPSKLGCDFDFTTRFDSEFCRSRENGSRFPIQRI